MELDSYPRARSELSRAKSELSPASAPEHDQNETPYQRRSCGQWSDREGLPLFGLHLDGTNLSYRSIAGERDAPKGKAYDANDDQDDSDNTHGIPVLAVR